MTIVAAVDWVVKYIIITAVSLRMFGVCINSGICCRGGGVFGYHFLANRRMQWLSPEYHGNLVALALWGFDYLSLSTLFKQIPGALTLFYLSNFRIWWRSFCLVLEWIGMEFSFDQNVRAWAWEACSCGTPDGPMRGEGALLIGKGTTMGPWEVITSSMISKTEFSFSL